jgi:hypothetical protein
MSAHTRILALLAAIVAAQLAVPAWMILRCELVLRNGTALRFRTAPVDPYDAFRGRYVALGFDVQNVPCRSTFRPNQPLYVLTETDTNGFARLVRAAHAPDAPGTWLKVSARRWSPMSGATVAVDLPFDRFYMDEFQAPEAERAYRSATWRRAGERQPGWLQVRVFRGMAVPEELYVDGKPVRETIRKAQK